MVELIYIDGILGFKGHKFTCGSRFIEGDACIINLLNADNDFYVMFTANQTTINGILQTSAQMISDTLSNINQ
jgi:hypothetical protein